MTDLNWSELYLAAKTASERAYAPYSHFPVGVAILAESGKVYQGCNVENASYGATICAERNAIAAAIVAGEKRFNALLVYTPQLVLTPPCGLCRQVIAEFFAQDSLVASCNHLQQRRQWTVQQLLPDAFLPAHLTDS